MCIVNAVIGAETNMLTTLRLSPLSWAIVMQAMPIVYPVNDFTFKVKELNEHVSTNIVGTKKDRDDLLEEEPLKISKFDHALGHSLSHFKPFHVSKKLI